MASPKNRAYFITINQSAECYNEIEDIIKDMNVELFALITHDKDVIIQDDGSALPKATHKHLMLEVKNPISFDSVRNKFKGAHIEAPKYRKATYQYLLHESPNSKEKYQYSFDDIISNRIESVKEIITSEEGIELFKESKFLDYILDGVLTPYQFVKRFGLNAYKQYWSSYSDMLSQRDKDSEMIYDLKRLKEEREYEFEQQELELGF